MFSPRTARYVEAMISEGEHFDYRTWLRRVREEEAQSKQVPVVFSSGEAVASEIGDLTNMSEHVGALGNSGSALQAKLAPIPRTVYRSDDKAKTEGPKARLSQRLVMVCNAWDDFQECRKRDAVYGLPKDCVRLSRGLHRAPTDQTASATCLPICRSSVRPERRPFRRCYSLHI